MHIEFYLPLWPVVAWLLIGSVLIVPLNLYAGTQVSPRRGWRRSLWNRQHHLRCVASYVVSIVLWPFAIWEVFGL